MTFKLSVILGSTMAFAAVLGAIRYKSILKSYRPFLFFIWLTILGDFVNDMCIKFLHSSQVSSNIYTLLEFSLIVWIFASWNKIYGNKRMYVILLSGGIAIWILDNLILYSLHNQNSIFRIAYSLILVYLSINQINQLLFTAQKKIIYNSQFIICVTFLLYFTYKATFEIFFLVQAGWSNDFYIKLFSIFVFVNLLSNILYALAVICIPKKQRFILPY